MIILGVLNQILETLAPSVVASTNSNVTNTFINVTVTNNDDSPSTLFAGVNASSADFSTSSLIDTNVPTGEPRSGTFTRFSGSVENFVPGDLAYVRARAETTGKTISPVVTALGSPFTLPKLRMANPAIERIIDTTSTQRFRITNMGPGGTVAILFYRFCRDLGTNPFFCQVPSEWIQRPGTFVQGASFTFDITNLYSFEHLRVEARAEDANDVRRTSIANVSTFNAPRITAPAPDVVNFNPIEARAINILMTNNYGSTANFWGFLESYWRIRQESGPTTWWSEWQYVGGDTILNNTTLSGRFSSSFFVPSIGQFVDIIPGTQYRVEMQNRGFSVLDSGITTRFVTTAVLPRAATPTTATDDSVTTSSSIRFIITNNENQFGTIAWNIAEGSATGPIVRNGSSFVFSSGTSFNVNATGLSASTSYVLRDVIMTPSSQDFAPSLEATRRTITTTAGPLLSTPNTANIANSATTSSVSFSIQNTEPRTVTMEWFIREGSTSGNIANQGPTSFSSNQTQIVSASGLNPGTRYFLTGVRATQSGFTSSGFGTVRDDYTIVELRGRIITSTGNFISVPIEYSINSGTTQNTTFSGSNTDSPFNLFATTTVFSSVTFTAPQFFSAGGFTYTFAVWRFNGNEQSAGATTRTASSITGTLNAEAEYVVLA